MQPGRILRHDTTVFELPPLTAYDLAQTIAARNPDAAAGLDGWRTTDLHVKSLLNFSNQLKMIVVVTCQRSLCAQSKPSLIKLGLRVRSIKD